MCRELLQETYEVKQVINHTLACSIYSNQSLIVVTVTFKRSGKIKALLASFGIARHRVINAFIVICNKIGLISRRALFNQ
jgi:hypothetical protein